MPRATATCYRCGTIWADPKGTRTAGGGKTVCADTAACLRRRTLWLTLPGRKPAA